MRKRILITGALVALALLALPLLAANFRVIRDDFDLRAGEGHALLQMDTGEYAEILYKDADGSRSYTAGDLIVKATYFKPRWAATKPGPVSFVPRG